MYIICIIYNIRRDSGNTSGQVSVGDECAQKLFINLSGRTFYFSTDFQLLTVHCESDFQQDNIKIVDLTMSSK